MLYVELPNPGGAGDITQVPDSPIFILASGQRCGSTLLQRLLNSHPEVMIWGEQEGHVERFLIEHQSLSAWAARHDDLRLQFLRDGYNGFLPNMLPDATDIQDAGKQYLKNLFGRPALRMGRPLWGFKEVRYDSYVALLLMGCFPEARIVHLTRNVWDCYRSIKRWQAIPGRWSPKWTKMALDDWVRINASFLKDAAQFPRLLRIRFEDAVADPQGTCSALASFVGVDANGMDRTVFDQRLSETSDSEAATGVEPSQVVLDEFDRALLGGEDVVAVARALGYEPP